MLKSGIKKDLRQALRSFFTYKSSLAVNPQKAQGDIQILIKIKGKNYVRS